MNPRTLDRTHRRRTGAPSLADAIALHGSGRLADAEAAYRAVVARTPHHAEALGLLGVVRIERADPTEGLSLLRHAAGLRPDDPAILNNLGLALQRTGQSAEAATILEALVRDHAGEIEPWLNLGNARRGLGDLEGAEAAYRRYVDLGGDRPEATYNLGCILMDLGRRPEADAAFAALLRTVPGHAEALNNRGTLAFEAGDAEAAERFFRDALRAAPGHDAARANLGQVLRESGRAGEALETLWEVVRAHPDDASAWTRFASTFRHVRFGDDADVEELLAVLLGCLCQPALDHQDLGSVAVRIFRADPALRPVFAAVDEGPDALFEAVSDPTVRQALRRPVVRLALERMLLPDLGLEAAFTALRRSILWAAASGTLPDEDLGLAASVARQCFHNGYVWQYGPDEVEVVESMALSVADRPLSADAGDPARVRALASYVRLLEWDRAEEVMEMAEGLGDTDLNALVRQQIVEPYQESVYREAIPRFETEVDDAVSNAVRAQYEEHPYPRWISVDHRTPRSVAAVLDSVLPGGAPEGVAAWTRPQILVAGCGTGKHLVETARRFADADVVGIDLSTSSLAYALRKAAEMGLDDLELMQADILALDRWDRTFDLIECGGVLHHMSDPMAGWRVLTDRLRPGGLMHVGLYSEAARVDVVRARELIAREGFESTADGIRAARPILAEHLGGEGRSLTSWRDFYSTEECRDLCFHVQEHRYTLPRLEAELAELGLEFLGFEMVDPTLDRRFRERFPEADPCSLAAWSTFEAEEPSTFGGMYQFWVRKPA
ncbi:MAG: tetratricopeptide repeat protein [Longimicrobiales bacterium]